MSKYEADETVLITLSFLFTYVIHIVAKYVTDSLLYIFYIFRS